MAEPTRLKNMRVKPDHDASSFKVKLQNIIKPPPKFSFPPIFPSPFTTFNIKRSSPKPPSHVHSFTPLTGVEIWDPQTWPGFMMPTALFFLKCGIWAFRWGFFVVFFGGGHDGAKKNHQPTMSQWG